MKLIKQDCTFTQSVPYLLNQGISRTYFCYDLSAFTDRFSIDIIFSLLVCVIGKVKAEAWYDIMVGYPFDLRNSESEPISYKVGTPMGFLSSWGLSTLCHHLMLYICCEKIGKPFSSAEYYLLGDDIIIYDDVLAEEYLKLMNSIGVEISSSKTLISDKIYEFAKRIFLPNGEVSPCSTKGFKEHARSFTAFYMFLDDLRSKGFNFKENLVTTGIS